MNGFVLDTSGSVALYPGYIWSDLDAFKQGYIKALFASSADALWDEAQGHVPAGEERDRRFSDLAPETLARIIADCADYTQRLGRNDLSQADGQLFWTDRQSGDADPDFSPLTPYLDADGRVYLREA